jgi:transcriptional regulator with XRE-family HTH domain
MTTFGERLKTERNRLDMTQTELAEIGDVKKNAQSLYERDENPPTADYLARVAKVGVDIHYLFYGVYSDTAASQQFRELLSVLHKLSPEQQAIGFGMLSMLQSNTPDAEQNVQRANDLWRATRLYNQFLAMNDKEKQMVEIAATIMEPASPAD